MSDTPDWDPDNEVDPAKVQREYMQFMKEMMADLKKAKAEDRSYLGSKPAIGMGAVMAPPRPKPPTFEDKKAQVKKAWEATKEIAPDAHYAVQCNIFQILVNFIQYPHVGSGFATLAEPTGYVTDDPGFDIAG